MAKLSIKSDGSIAYELEDTSEEVEKKNRLERMKEIRGSVLNSKKSFKNLTPQDKDNLLELLLLMNNLI